MPTGNLPNYLLDLELALKTWGFETSNEGVRNELLERSEEAFSSSIDEVWERSVASDRAVGIKVLELLGEQLQTPKNLSEEMARVLCSDKRSARDQSGGTAQQGTEPSCPWLVQAWRANQTLKACSGEISPRLNAEEKSLLAACMDGLTSRLLPLLQFPEGENEADEALVQRQAVAFRRVLAAHRDAIRWREGETVPHAKYHLRPVARESHLRPICQALKHKLVIEAELARIDPYLGYEPDPAPAPEVVRKRYEARLAADFKDWNEDEQGPYEASLLTAAAEQFMKGTAGFHRRSMAGDRAAGATAVSLLASNLAVPPNLQEAIQGSRTHRPAALDESSTTNLARWVVEADSCLRMLAALGRQRGGQLTPDENSVLRNARKAVATTLAEIRSGVKSMHSDAGIEELAVDYDRSLRAHLLAMDPETAPDDESLRPVTRVRHLRPLHEALRRKSKIESRLAGIDRYLVPRPPPSERSNTPAILLPIPGIAALSFALYLRSENVAGGSPLGVLVASALGVLFIAGAVAVFFHRVRRGAPPERLGE